MSQMASKNMSLGTATIGPQSWRNDCLKKIHLSQSIVQKSDKACKQGRAVDPFPHLRDSVANVSNNVGHTYFRQVRSVVCLLRESLLQTDIEIKALCRGKESLEKAVEHIVKDIRLNEESHEIRHPKSSCTKDHDGVDDLLTAEKMHLVNLKKMLKSQQQTVQQQLLVLDRSRRRLATVVQERSQVLDLVCQTLPSIGSSTMSAVTPRPSSTNLNNDACGVRSSYSSIGGGGSSMFNVDPLGVYTPESDAAIQEATQARDRSAMLRSTLKGIISKAGRIQSDAHKSVNQGLTQKIAETVDLKQHLHMAAGSNRHALHRAQRWYSATEKAWGYCRGPVASSDLSNSERLDRPLVKVFQRHPGTNLPDAQEIVMGGNGLLESLTETSQNIGLLKLARLQLKDDIRDKEAAIGTDGSIVRLRRRKANHRWAMGEAF